MAKGIQVGVELTMYNKGYKQGLDDAKKATADFNRNTKQHAKEVETSFKQVTMAVGKIGAVIIVAKEAFQVYEKAMKSTHGTAEQFEIMMSKVKFQIDEISRSAASEGFKGFGERIKEAAENGKKLSEQLELIFELTQRQKLLESGGNLGMSEQALIYKNRKNPIAVRIAAATEFLRLNKELEKSALSLAQQEAKGAMAQSSVAASKLSEERLRYYVESADLLAKNEKEVIKYARALKDLNEELAKPIAVTKSQKANVQGVFQRPWMVSDLKKELSGYSQLVADFGQDYEKYMLIIDPEKSKLTDSWAKLDVVMTTANLNAAKPLRTVNSLLTEEEKSIDKIISAEQKRLVQLKELNKITPVSFGKVYLSGKDLNINSLRPAPVMPDINLERYNDELKKQQRYVVELENVFTSFFENTGKGWKAMSDAFVQAIEKMAAVAAAKIVIFAILDVLSGGSGQLAQIALNLLGGNNLGSWMGIPGSSGNLPGTVSGEGLMGMNRGQNINLNVTGKLMGSDIYLSGARYGNYLNSNS